MQLKVFFEAGGRDLEPIDADVMPSIGGRVEVPRESGASPSFKVIGYFPGGIVVQVWSPEDEGME